MKVSGCKRVVFRVAGLILFTGFGAIGATSASAQCWQCQQRLQTYSCFVNDAGWKICNPYFDHREISGACRSGTRESVLSSADEKNAAKVACAPTATSQVLGPAPKYSNAEIADARQVDVSVYLDHLTSGDSDIKAHQLHSILSGEKTDVAWSDQAASVITEEVANLPDGMRLRLGVLEAKCGTTLCELRAAGEDSGEAQVDQDQATWQAQIQRLNSSGAMLHAGFDPDLNTNLVGTTPDGRPLFISFFLRKSGLTTATR